jgi:hypothetical protein
MSPTAVIAGLDMRPPFAGSVNGTLMPAGRRKSGAVALIDAASNANCCDDVCADNVIDAAAAITTPQLRSFVVRTGTQLRHPYKQKGADNPKAASAATNS